MVENGFSYSMYSSNCMGVKSFMVLMKPLTSLIIYTYSITSVIVNDYIIECCGVVNLAALGRLLFIKAHTLY